MSISYPYNLTAEDYDRLANEYLRTLPLEHFMESTHQSVQREIVLASLALLNLRRPDADYFSELLVQYVNEGQVRRVVPDVMIVLECRQRVNRSNYAVELEAAPLFMAMEFVSASNPRKDYEDSFRKYEQELQVPYCAMYRPERRDLRVHRHDGQQYIRLEPDGSGRVEIPELDLQLGLIDGWMRLWHEDRLLELPADLARHIDEQTKQLEEKLRQLDERSRELEEAKSQLVALTTWLRTQVKERASKAGRQDLIEQADAADASQLQQWLDKLK